MLWKRNKKTDPAADFDKTGKRPVIRASICTGEKVAGFRDESGSGRVHADIQGQGGRDREGVVG